MQIYTEYDLTPHNTFAVPARARYFIRISALEDIDLLVQDEFFRSVDHLIIGGGSNLLFVGDYSGCILHYEPSAVQVLREDECTISFRAEGGKEWHRLVTEVARKGYWGIENLALIPGEVGAAAVQNIGAYGVEICDVLDAVHTVSLRTGEKRSYTREECGYAYRHSIFKEQEYGHVLVYAVDLTLSKEPRPVLSYAGLQELREVPIDSLSPVDVVAHVVRIREQKLPDPDVLPNAGSFFMNPIISKTGLGRLQEQYNHVPHYLLEGDRVKIPAAWLIEQCGLKGKRFGSVGCYEKQPLVIVNYDNAHGQEIYEHAQRVQEAVKSHFGVDLTPEVRYII